MHPRLQPLILWFLIFSLPLYSQNTARDSGVPTFKTKVNVVLLDITVMKGKEAVSDLHKETSRFSRMASRKPSCPSKSTMARHLLR